MRRILVPTDFSEPSRQAIHHALALAATIEGDLLLLHVVEGDPLPRYIVGETPDICTPWRNIHGSLLQPSRASTIISHDRCEEARWKLASLLPPGCPKRFRALVTVGKVAKEINRVARSEQVDLILLGTQGQRRWQHVFWPSVPAQVMRRTSIPVMVLCTAGRCLPPPLRKHGGAWLQELEQQLWPVADDLEHRSYDQNDISDSLEAPEIHVPHRRG